MYDYKHQDLLTSSHFNVTSWLKLQWQQVQAHIEQAEFHIHITLVHRNKHKVMLVTSSQYFCKITLDMLISITHIHSLVQLDSHLMGVPHITEQ